MQQRATLHTDTPAPAPERFVMMREILSRVPLDRTTIYRLSQRGRFPVLRRIGDRRVGVLESELRDWMVTR